MGRKRQIDPIFPFEKEIRGLSIPARYFYILSWCHMSDPDKAKGVVGGVIPYDVFFLKNNIFPEEVIDIQPIIDELIAQRRYFLFFANEKTWIWCPTMHKHQTINHPSKPQYPDPPKELQEGYRSTTVALTQSRVELSRVEVKKQPYWAAFDNKTQEILKTISKDINIYQFLGKLKKDRSIELPEGVVLRVCASWQKNKTGVVKKWPWFIKATKMEWEDHNASEQIRQGNEYKRAPVVLRIGDLLKGNHG